MSRWIPKNITTLVSDSFVCSGRMKSTPFNSGNQPRVGGIRECFPEDDRRRAHFVTTITRGQRGETIELSSSLRDPYEVMCKVTPKEGDPITISLTTTTATNLVEVLLYHLRRITEQ